MDTYVEFKGGDASDDLLGNPRRVDVSDALMGATMKKDAIDIDEERRDLLDGVYVVGVETITQLRHVQR